MIFAEDNGSFISYIYTDGRITFYVSGNNPEYIYSDYYISLNTWYKIKQEYDADTNKYKLWVDNDLVYIESYTSANPITMSDQ